MSAADPERRRQIAALGADASWANTEDWTARTATARQARWDQYENQVDPDKKLDPVTRAKRAEKAMKVHMRLMSRKGVLTRRRNTWSRLIGWHVEIVLSGGETVRGLLSSLDDDVVTALDKDGLPVVSASLSQVERLVKAEAA